MQSAAWSSRAAFTLAFSRWSSRAAFRVTSTQLWKHQGWSNPNTYPATVTILLCLILLWLSTASCSPFAYQKRPRPSTSKTNRNSCPRLRSLRFRLLLFYRLQWRWSKPTTHIRWQSWVYSVHSASSSSWLSSTGCSPLTNRRSFPRLRSRSFALLFFYCLQWCWSKPSTYAMASMSLLCLLLILRKLLGPFLPNSDRQLWSLTLTYRNAMFNRRKHRICDMPCLTQI